MHPHVSRSNLQKDPRDDLIVRRSLLSLSLERRQVRPPQIDEREKNSCFSRSVSSTRLDALFRIDLGYTIAVTLV